MSLKTGASKNNGLLDSSGFSAFIELPVSKSTHPENNNINKEKTERGSAMQ
jgi:hypothetical protein